MKQKLNLFRRKFIIYPRFQLSLVALDVVIMLGSYAILMLALRHSYATLRAEGVAAGLVEGHSYFQFLERQSMIVYGTVSVVFTGAFLLSCVLTILVSHRMAGPIVRLRAYFENIAQGATPTEPLSFRKKDYFADLPDAVNRALRRFFP